MCTRAWTNVTFYIEVQISVGFCQTFRDQMAQGDLFLGIDKTRLQDDREKGLKRLILL